MNAPQNEMEALPPLAGKRIVVTRAEEQSGELTRLLSREGAEVIHLPVIAFTEPLELGPLDAAIKRLGKFDWLLFTSQNAVRFFVAHCRKAKFALPRGEEDKPRVAAVGSATARAAEKEGFVVRHVPRESRGLNLAQELGGELSGERVLLPRSDIARSDLPEALRAAGADVTEVVAYRTVAAARQSPEAVERLLRGEVDVVTFASPSAFHFLAQETGVEPLRCLASKVAVAAIGPVTANVLHQAGIPVAIQASESTSRGLLNAITAYFSPVYGRGANRR